MSAFSFFLGRKKIFFACMLSSFFLFGWWDWLKILKKPNFSSKKCLTSARAMASNIRVFFVSKPKSIEFEFVRKNAHWKFKTFFLLILDVDYATFLKTWTKKRRKIVFFLEKFLETDKMKLGNFNLKISKKFIKFLKFWGYER